MPGPRKPDRNADVFERPPGRQHRNHEHVKREDGADGDADETMEAAENCRAGCGQRENPESASEVSRVLDALRNRVDRCRVRGRGSEGSAVDDARLGDVEDGP